MLCSGLLGVGCFGGPISDWPPRNDDKEPTSDRGDDESQGDDDSADDDSDSPVDDDGKGEPPTSGGGKRDAGTATPGAIDAGARPGMDAGSPTAPSEPGDGGVADGAVDPGTECTPMSDGRAQGACFGSYCRMTPSALSASVKEGAACSGADELELACDGTIARAVAACAQREALAIGMGRAILGCARRTMGLTEVAEGCLSCYVEEVVCSVRSCLAACLDGASQECGACRAERCGDRFLACSGLPAPDGPAPSIPSDGGMSLAACTPGADQTCNDDPAISSLHGRCRPDGTCVCVAGFEQDPLSGRCR